MDKLNNIIVATFCLASCSSTFAAADIYDVLRGTRGTPSISYSDVEAAQLAAGNFDPNQPQTETDTSQTQPTTLREEAFKELLNKTFPLLPDQIQELHRQYDKSKQAINSSPNTPPQPISSTMRVDLSPGATPPVIRLATGFVTSIVFVDGTGAPWPVSDYSLGNPTGFNIKWDTKTNALFIQSTEDHISGNLAVRLADLETPVMISIVTGQRDVDYRVDLQVPGAGPHAQAAVVDNGLPQGTSPVLLSVLDGVPPTGSIELCVAQGYGRAWKYNGKLLFRTKLTLLSPAWSATVSSADGTRVYELMETPLLLASQNGKTIKIELSGM